jgi:hypothetical protein
MKTTIALEGSLATIKTLDDLCKKYAARKEANLEEDVHVKAPDVDDGLLEFALLRKFKKLIDAGDAWKDGGNALTEIVRVYYATTGRHLSDAQLLRWRFYFM